VARGVRRDGGPHPATQQSIRMSVLPGCWARSPKRGMRVQDAQRPAARGLSQAALSHHSAAWPCHVSGRLWALCTT
jgi:hypothetical protein